MSQYKTIGILGGMGPEATADMYMGIIEIFQKRFGAKYDKDFPPIFVYSMPIPDVVEELENEKLLIPLLIQGVKRLELAGSDFIVIACNTVQYYLSQMRKAVSIPILSMAEETAKAIKNRDYGKVGLLGTKITVKTGLFDNECKKQGIKILIPDEIQQEAITKIIMNILAGTNMDADRKRLEEIIKSLQARGAEAVILGCTDLPLIIKQKDSPLELFDATKIMAEAAVRESKKDL